MQKIVLNALENSLHHVLRDSLIDSFAKQTEAFAAVEQCFCVLPTEDYEPSVLRFFFHGWSMTNNSAMTVAGIANRLSALMGAEPAPERPLSLFRSIVDLHRIIDEDLGVRGGVLHWDLYRRMANYFCASDDWLSQRYASDSATAFKAWKDNNSLRNRDLTMAFLTTIVHEIYTHGEVEYILPIFRRWLESRGSRPIQCVKSTRVGYRVKCCASGFSATSVRSVPGPLP